MIEITAADAGQHAAWSEDWQGQLRAWFAGFGAARSAEQLIRGWQTATEQTLGLLVAAGEVIGHVAVCIPQRQDRDDPVATVVDILVSPEHRRRGHGRAAREFAVDWARTRAPKAGVLLWGLDPGVRALFAEYPVRHQRMFKPLSGIPELRPGVVARAMAEAEYPAWRRTEIVEYANDMSASGTLTPAEAEVVSAKTYDEMLPDGLGTPGNEWAVVEAGGEPVATIWIGHDWGPAASFVYSVEVHPEYRGKGYGRAAMQAGEAMTARAGRRYLGLNVFGHNTVAIGLYLSLNYVVVDQSRSITLA